ncbi:MAG: ABC transporter permease [Bacillota bacterium]|nr:ABC transporter permease [Bacillota bacterium]
MAKLVPEYFLPAPSQIFARYATLLREPIYGENTLLQHFLVSLRRVMMGFALGVVTGVPLGILMGWNKRVEAAVDPLFELFRPIPPIAWIPLVILWLGIGETPKIFLIWIGAFIPLVINSYTGVKQTPEILLRAARTMGAKDKDLLLEVAIPSSVPYLLAGLRVALGNCWAILVASELVAAQSGLGYMMNIARRYLDTTGVITGMLTIGVVGWLLDSVLRVVQSKIPWNEVGSKR